MTNSEIDNLVRTARRKEAYGFKVGDVVWLVGGGPSMTVIGFGVRSYEGYVTCARSESNLFLPECLTKTDPNPQLDGSRDAVEGFRSKP